MSFTVYHSTMEKNIASILSNGFQDRFGSCYGLTFGRGVYTTSDLKYAASYNIECDKILECEINPVSVMEMNTREYKKNVKRIKTEEPDLVIIKDAREFVCRNLSVIRVVAILNVEKLILDDKLVEVNVLERINLC